MGTTRTSVIVSILMGLYFTLALFYTLPTCPMVSPAGPFQLTSSVHNIHMGSSLRDDPFKPCRCGVGNCTCGVLYVLSNSTPVIDMYKDMFARYGGRKPHHALLPQAIAAFRQHHARDKFKVAVMIDDDSLLDANVRQMIDVVEYINTSSQTKPWAEALSGMVATPWVKTLYMDADTRTCAPLDDVFEILDHVDFAAVPSRKDTRRLVNLTAVDAEAAIDYVRPTIPFLFRPYSAFYAYRHSDLAWRVLQRAKFLDETTNWPHMDALAAAMREQSTLSFYPLPPEYHWVNRSYEYPVLFTGQVRSLHGVETDCMRINTGPHLRLFDGDVAATLDPQNGTMVFRWFRGNGSGVGSFRYGGSRSK